jgi:hypothetical protein
MRSSSLPCVHRATLSVRAVLGRVAAFTGLLLFVTIATAEAQAPDVEWRQRYWSHDVAGNWISPSISGEDWWYDHVTSRANGSGAINGFICAGFFSLPNIWTNENDYGGCIDLTAPSTSYDCSSFETPTFMRGSVMTTISLVDQNGLPQWVKKFAPGELFRVIQTSDGDYVAVGYTRATRMSANEVLSYNPGQEPGEVSDNFVGRGCSSEPVAPHVYVIKVDATGNLLWQHLYGMEPYRNASGAIDQLAAYQSRGTAFGVTETDDGYLITGSINDPHFGFGRIFMMQIADDGLWKWGSFYGPTDFSSTGQAVTTYHDGPNEKYVLSATEYYAGSNGAHQRAMAMQFDGSATSAPASSNWMQHSFDINTTANQSTFDVRIQEGSSNTILLPVIVNGNHLLWAAYNRGEAKVFRLDPATGSTISSTSFGEVTAYDLKLRVCPTPDGGFGVVSSKRVACALDPLPPCHLDRRYWQTDAYVARCNSCGEIEWEETFTDLAPYNGSYPGNEKQQECLYSISQAADGGFVVSGNSSYNFDDAYLVKLEPETQVPGGLYLKDTPGDYGYEPNPDTGPMWISSDIWVRNSQDDANYSHAGQHQNPEYRSPALGQPSWIYVRVRNRGCSALPSTGILNVYAAGAATGLSWPSAWTTNVPSGGQRTLGEITGFNMPPITVTLSGNAETIVGIPWYPPDPSSGQATGGHVCILARLTPGIATAETSDIYWNVRNNNNVIWKNLTVVDLWPGVQGPFQVKVFHDADSSKTVRLTFGAPAEELADSLLDHVRIDVDLGQTLTAAWRRNAFRGTGLEQIGETLFRITSDSAWAELMLRPKEGGSIGFSFSRTDSSAPTRSSYNFDLVHLVPAGDSAAPRIVGGERYLLNMTNRRWNGPLVHAPDRHEVSSRSAGFLSCTPNPSNREVDVAMTLPSDGEIRLQLFDHAGRAVRDLLDEWRAAGVTTVHIDLSDLPSGAYSIVLTSEATTQSVQFVLKK